ncbi:MAG: hypothetical protein ABIB61_01815 [Candidatus Shapirobacteria bacterium]
MLSHISQKIKKFGWGKFILALVLIIIILVNFKPGYFILGNDNYSPELNPKLSLSRYLLNPAWRGYRALGVASDADQADVYRAALYFLLSPIFPGWLLSQIFIFSAFFVSSWAAACFSLELVKNKLKKNEKQLLFLFSGLANLVTLLTIWMFFSPLIPFMSAFAFLPLVLWRLLLLIRKFNLKNSLLFLGATAIFSTCSIVPTTFLVCLAVIAYFLLVYYFLEKPKIANKKLLARLFLAFGILVIFQLPWILSFGAYLKTNTQALQESYINRILTPNLVEHEARVGNAKNVLRYYAAWIEEVNDNGSSVYPFRSWYQENIVAQFTSYLPIILAFLGVTLLFGYRQFGYFLIIFLALSGWFLLKGINPPFGFVFSFLQDSIPLFKQVFRWQSSKLWALLSTTLPLLAGLGIIFINRLKRIKHSLKIAIFALIALLEIVYIFPLFIGKMIQSENYVRIPQDYYSLAEFLKENDSQSRIYLAPEANTLYFRQYSWGFWGSSFLNYLLPNPILEKAMTTGSTESEDAQKVLEENYYSKDPLSFVSALSRYNTSLVLSDKSAARMKNGYEYDWIAHKIMTEENQYLEKIWESGNLSLFRVKNDPSSESLKSFPVISGHNWRQLNNILAFSNEAHSYYSQEDKPGVIYPLALSFSQTEFGENEISFLSSYLTKSANYSFSLAPEEISNLPVKISKRSNGSLSFFPSFPILRVNGKSVFNADFGEIEINPRVPADFVSLNNYVFDFRDFSQEKVSEVKFGDLDNAKNTLVLAWSASSPLASKLNIAKNLRPNFIPEKDSIVEMEISIQADQEAQANLCVWSELRLKCLHPNISKILEKGEQRIKILVPEVIFGNEKITIFLEPATVKEENLFSLESVAIWLYQKNNRLLFPRFNYNNVSIFSQINLKQNDLFEVVMPRIYGQNQFQLSPWAGFLPEFSLTGCDKENGIIEELGDGLRVYTDNCYGSVFEKLLRFNPNLGLAALIYQGENYSGIPLDVGIKSDKGGYYFLRNRLFPQGDTSRREYVSLPQETRSYILDLFSFATGPHPSLSRMDNLAFQFIPKAWLEWKLIPADLEELSFIPINNLIINNNGSEKKIFSLSQAVSPSWKLKNSSGESIRINGWEQGWIFSEPIETKIVFGPDKLAYFGYTILVVSLILLLWQLARKKKAEQERA